MAQPIHTRTAFVATLALVITGLGGGSVAADGAEAPADPVEVINHDFSAGTGDWWSYANDGASHSLDASSGALCLTSDAMGAGSAGMGLTGWPAISGEATFSFDIKGTGSVQPKVEVPDNTALLSQQIELDAGDEFTSHSYNFSLNAGEGAIKFILSGQSDPVCIDNVQLTVVPGESTADGLQPGMNLLNNGDFSNGEVGWGPYGHDFTTESGQFCSTVSGPLAEPWDAGMSQSVELPQGDYVLTFDAWTTGSFSVVVQENGPPHTWYGGGDVSGAGMTSYEFPVSVGADQPNGTVAFHFGPLAEGESYEFCLDNVFLGEPSVEYTDGYDWSDWLVIGTTADFEGSAMCVDVPANTVAPHDVIIKLPGLDLPQGPYTLTFEASGDNGPVRPVVGQASAPWDAWATIEGLRLTAEMDQYVMYATVPYDHDDSEIAFQIGGADFDWRFCLDNVSLASGGQKPAYEPPTGPAIKVNQHGYETHGPKRATLVTDVTDPLEWALVNVDTEATTASGLTEPFGDDPSAGENVHVINFDGDHPAGTYVLRVDGSDSHSFTIAPEQYSQLRYDALNYFYLARSGIEIEASIVGEEYARGAGHVSEAGGPDANQGDYNVACQPAENSLGIYGEPWTCDYTLDVVGGWYDAGDHGKYVVNGGISVAQVMGTYERLLRAEESDRAALGDNTLNLPETGNGVPDPLDEARWQLDFMMSMIVPDGEPLAGMVHHKIHDFGWSALPLLPENATGTRYLHRPSTAATLNLSAAAAQGARLWEEYDADYTETLLRVAESTWAAALDNPALYAPVEDGDFGGGPYDDTDVSDEFYWAAAELFITTGNSEYEQFLLNSPVHTEESFMGPGLSWSEVAAVAKINLATVDNDFVDRDAIAKQVIAAGEATRTIQQAEPFGHAMAADGYEWGSSSEVLNAIVVLGAAYDLSGDPTLLAAAQESMDYLLGRNALGQSYVTGYGTQYSKNQHSRWFANQIAPSLPNPPPGSVAGGPNRMADTWDPVIQGLYPNADCAPQKCYVDEIESWSTNEITINWNSALSAAVGFLASPEAPASGVDGTDPGGGEGGSPGEGGGSDDEPGTDPDGAPLPQDQLSTKDKGGIEVPDWARAGDTITIKVGTDHTGTATMTYLYSQPTLIGQSVVNEEGNIQVTIPADTPPGTHTIAVYDADGNLLGWDTIEILAADSSLAVTGADGYLLSLALSLLLVFGGVTMVLRQSNAS